MLEHENDKQENHLKQYGCSKRDQKTIYGFFSIVHLKSVYNHAWNDQVQYDFG